MRAIRTGNGSRLIAVAAIAMLGLVANPSFADDEGKADEKIQAMTVELKQLEVKDERNAATAQIGKAEALRDKARSIIGERKQEEALKRTLAELEAIIALASAKIVAADKRAKLEAAEQQLASVKQELKSTETEVAQLEKQQAELDKKLGGGK